MSMERVTATGYSESEAKVYDKKRFTSQPGKIVHQLEFGRVHELLNRVGRDTKVLEVGCGTGRLLTESRALGYRVDGADASDAMLQEIRNKVEDKYPDLELKLSEAADMPWENNTFDAVYSIRLLNQTESPAYALRVVREMSRVARDDGGLVLVEFINTWRPRIGLNRRPTTRLRPSEVITALQESGANLIWCKGNFFFGMAAYEALPERLLPAFRKLDILLATALPRLCSRCYVLAENGEDR